MACSPRRCLRMGMACSPRRSLRMGMACSPRRCLRMGMAYRSLVCIDDGWRRNLRITGHLPMFDQSGAIATLKPTVHQVVAMNTDGGDTLLPHPGHLLAPVIGSECGCIDLAPMGGSQLQLRRVLRHLSVCDASGVTTVAANGAPFVRDVLAPPRDLCPPPLPFPLRTYFQWSTLSQHPQHRDYLLAVGQRFIAVFVDIGLDYRSI